MNDLRQHRSIATAKRLHLSVSEMVALSEEVKSFVGRLLASLQTYSA